MGDPKAWAAAIKDVLSYSAPFLPISVGSVLMSVGIIVALVFLLPKVSDLIRAWRCK